MMILGPATVTTKFSPRMTVLSSHEGTAAWLEIYGYVHSENIHPSFRMSDGAKLIFIVKIRSFQTSLFFNEWKEIGIQEDFRTFNSVHCQLQINLPSAPAIFDTEIYSTERRKQRRQEDLSVMPLPAKSISRQKNHSGSFEAILKISKKKG